MLEFEAKEGDGFSITSKRNCSIAPFPLCVCFVAAGLISLTIALVWTWLGAWLILPFAGLEVAALVLAFVLNARHAGDYERIRLRPGLLTLEICSGSRVSRHELNPHWAQVVEAGSGMGRRVVVMSHGREYEVGRHLDDDARQWLAKELQRWLPDHRPR
jgi:uncharacterized membrane protein